MLDQALLSKSPLSKQDMICKFTCDKFDFSTQGRATLLAHTTTLILPDQALESFESSSTPSPFLLVTIPLPYSAASSTMNPSLFVANNTRENP
jgi:hypothetical protein